jgi:hypothetical protein
MSKLALLAALLGFSTTALAFDDWITVSGQINFDVTASRNGDFERNLRTQDAEITLEIALREGIKAVVKLELERALIQNGQSVESLPFDLEKFIEQAYIRIETDKVTNLPRAIITVGKHSMAFGQQISRMPMFKDNLLHKLNRQSEVIGLTVALNPSFLKIVDEVAISVFEARAGDLQIDNKMGASMKLSKRVNHYIRVTASALYKQSLDASRGDEARASLGFVWDNQDGTWSVWSEGIVFKNNPAYPDSSLAATAGVARKLGPGSVVVEYSYVQRFAKELGLAYNLPIGRNLVISPEVRYQFDRANGAPNDVRVGVRARVVFQQTAPKPLLPGPVRPVNIEREP